MPITITEADLRRYCPGADQHYVAALLGGQQALQAAGITDNPLRWSHFVAQCAHETGGLRIVREHTTWSRDRMCAIWPNRFKTTDPIFLAKYAMCSGDDRDMRLAELAYGGRRDIGNTEEGDGWAYRGGGFLQSTGRDCYREAGQAIGVDLEGEPDLIERPEVSLQVAIWYWSRAKLNDYADNNHLHSVSAAINCGNPHSSKRIVGEKEREKWFDRAWAIWGVGAEIPHPTDGLCLGARGPAVTAMQERLRELGYAPGNPDGIYGRETKRAVAAFKADWLHDHDDDLEPGDVIGPKTRAALASAEPIDRAERGEMTVADLHEAGSTEVAAGKKLQVGGYALTGMGMAAGAVQTGQDEQVRQALSWAPQYQAIISPCLDAVKWAVHNALWVVALVAGVWLYMGGWRVVQARLKAARSGRNLWR